MGLQFKCSECRSVEDNDPSCYCGDCWRKLLARIEELSTKVDRLEDELESEQAAREAEAEVFADESAKFRERVRLLEERLRAG